MTVITFYIAFLSDFLLNLSELTYAPIRGNGDHPIYSTIQKGSLKGISQKANMQLLMEMFADNTIVLVSNEKEITKLIEILYKTILQNHTYL